MDADVVRGQAAPGQRELSVWQLADDSADYSHYVYTNGDRYYLLLCQSFRFCTLTVVNCLVIAKQAFVVRVFVS